MSPTLRSDLALLTLSGVAVLADLACVLTGHTPPSLFPDIALAGLTGAAGVSLPLRASAPAAVDAPSAGTYPAPTAAGSPSGAGQ